MRFEILSLSCRAERDLTSTVLFSWSPPSDPCNLRTLTSPNAPQYMRSLTLSISCGVCTRYVSLPSWNHLQHGAACKASQLPMPSEW